MRPGYCDVIVGLDNGDEGKGKEIDHRIETGEYHINSRYNGGPNAGHSLVLPDGTDLVLHALPSAVLYPHIQLSIGSGCVVDPVKLLKEIHDVESRGYDLSGRLHIANTTQVISPVHILLDQVTGALVGTTGNGIGPAYADKATRSDGQNLKHIRFAEFLHNPKKVKQEYFSHYRDLLDVLRLSKYRTMINKYLINLGPKGVYLEPGDAKFPSDFDRYFNIERKVEQSIEAVEILNKRGFINRDPLWLTKQVQSGKNVLGEGAQGADLDVTKGPVPFNTGSHTWSGYAYTGGDLPPRYHRHTIGVTKAIPSRVGRGPFVSELGSARSDDYCAERDQSGQIKYTIDREAELYDVKKLLQSTDPFEFGIALRMLGKEYGATTARPRRMGVFDIRKLLHNCIAQGIDELVISKEDCLSAYHGNNIWQGKIPLVTSYLLHGQELDTIPVTADELSEVEPGYETVDSFEENISDIRDFADLPEAVQKFVQRVQEYTRTQVRAIGVGPKREQMIYL